MDFFQESEKIQEKSKDEKWMWRIEREGGE